jgi:hypothetical protein
MSGCAGVVRAGDGWVPAGENPVNPQRARHGRFSVGCLVAVLCVLGVIVPAPHARPWASGTGSGCPATSPSHAAPCGPLVATSRSSDAAGWRSAARVSGHAALIAPSALALGPRGTVFVADLRRDGVVVLSSTGRSLGVLGTRGSARAQFRMPSGVAADGFGRVFVTDSVNATVQEFAPTRGGYRFERSFGSWRAGGSTRRLARPVAVTVFGGGVYVGDARYGIVVFTANGAFKGSWSPGSQFVVKSVSPGPGGWLYATFGNRSGAPFPQRTYRLSANLRSRTNVGFADYSGTPYLAVDQAGNFFSLAGARVATVIKFEPQPGGFQELSFFTAPSGLHYGLAVDASDRVFLPSFASSPRTRGAIYVHAPVNRRDPMSDYRLTRVIRGG